MKYIRKNSFIISAILILSVVSCTKYNIIETGLANENIKTNMWEYFKTDDYNWSLLIEMAEYAELSDVFKGTSTYGKDITFLGIKNHSILRYMLEKDYKKITDIPKEECRKFILSCIINEKITLDDFLEGKPSSDPDKIFGEGGRFYTTLSGEELWIYTYRDIYGGVVGAGPKEIFIVSKTKNAKTTVDTSNIMTQTGVVHALSYTFTINDF